VFKSYEIKFFTFPLPISFVKLGFGGSILLLLYINIKGKSFVSFKKIIKETCECSYCWIQPMKIRPRLSAQKKATSLNFVAKVAPA
jgi:hypothetical protein